MKKLIALILSFALLIIGCAAPTSSDESNISDVTSVIIPDATESVEDDINDTISPSDPGFSEYVEDMVYYDMLSQIDSDEYVIESVNAIYLSQEYVEELAYNSQENVYFGYKLSDIQAAFEDAPYYFTVDENGNTVVAEYVECESPFEQMLKDLAIGSGVIVLCVTVSLVAQPLGAPAISMIFAYAAKESAKMAVSWGVISSITSGAITAYQTGDINETLLAAASSGAEGIKYGAIIGSVAGGAVEGLGLFRAARKSGLTIKEVATIQKETKYPLELISKFRNMDEYKVYKNLDLKYMKVKVGKVDRMMLLQDVDLDFISSVDNPNGLTNLELMQQGKAPFVTDGVRYELHHIGQSMDSPLALLTPSQHDLPGLHIMEETKINRTVWNKQRSDTYKVLANIFLGVV